MPTRTNFTPSYLPYVVDAGSLDRDGGRQIDWAQVPETFKNGVDYTVTLNDANANAGDTIITVDALPVKLPVGTVLDFGLLRLDEYTITVDDATAAIGDVALGVDALPVAIPAGTILTFSGAPGDTDEIATVSADAAAGATSLTVVKLPHAIADNATANFPGTSQQSLAKVATEAAAAATSIIVDALAGHIVDNATATVTFGGTGSKVIPAGTVMAQVTSGKIVPRSDRPGSETATCVLETAADELGENMSLSGYGTLVAGVLYQNLMPDFANAAWATFQTELNAAGVGHFVWRTYADTMPNA